MLVTRNYYTDNKTLVHVNRVKELCTKFVAAGVYVDEKLLLDAAVLHDIARHIDEKHHQERKYIALALVERNIGVDGINEFDDICIIIENHRGIFFPHRYIWESAVLRICDKLDKFNKAKEKANEAYDKAENKGKSHEKAVEKSEEKYFEKRKEAHISCEESMEEIEDFFTSLSNKRSQLKENLTNFRKAYKVLFEYVSR